MEFNQMYKAILENMNEAVYVRDLNMNLLYINPASERLTGWSLQEALGKKCHEVFRNENPACKDVCPVEKVVSEEPYSFHHRGKLKARSGEVRDMQVSISPLYEGKTLTGAIVVMEDLTHWREAGQTRSKTLIAPERIGKALRESEEKWCLLYDSLPCGSFTVNDKYIIEDVNDFLCTVTGFAKEELVGQFCGIICPKGPHKCPIFDMGKERIDNDETAVKTKDGRLVPIIKSARRIPLGEREVIVENFHDITQRKQVEEALKRRLEQLASLSRASQAVTASLKLDQVLAEIVSLAGEVLASDYANVVLVDEEGKWSRSVKYLPGAPDIDRRRTEDFTNWIIHSRQAVVVDDIDEDGTVSPRPPNGAPCTADPLVVEAGIKSFVGLPLVAKDRLLGVLYLHSLRPDNFCGQFPLLTTFANQAAVAIENARLFEETKRHFKETTALYQTSLDITAQLEMTELLKSIVERAVTLLRAKAGSIYLYDLEREELRHTIGYGYTEKYVGVTLKTGEGMAGKVLQTGEPLIVDDYRTWEGRAPVYEADQPFTAVLEVPLRWREQIIGVLAIDADARKRTFNQDDVWLATLFANQAAVAIENARIYEEERKRATQLELIGGINQRIASILDLDELLHQVAHLIRGTFGYYYTSILLIEQDRDELVLSAGAGPFIETLADLLRFKIGREGITGWVAHSGEPLLVNDVSHEPRYYSAEEAKDTRSELAVPIKLKGEIIGVLDVQSVELDAFSEDDVFTLQTLADQLAVAIENARLYQSERKRAAQLAVVNQVARRVASILDLDQLLHEVVTAIQQSFNYYHVGLFLLNKATGELKMQAIAGGFADTAPPDHRLAWGKGMAGWAAKTGQPLLANDVSQEPRYVLGILKEALTKAELCVPLKLAGQVIGVLDIQSTQLDAFDETDLMAMETLADQLAVAIENARLYQETMRQLEETETLSTVTTALTRSLDLDQVLQSIVDSATRLIPASTSGVIHLADEAAGNLIPRATSPSDIKIQETMGMPIGKGIAGLVMQEKRLINVPNVEQDPRFLPLDTGTLKKSLLTAPLMIDGDCIGTLSLNSDKVGAFSADDERLLTTLAAQATIAVRNARLHQEVQHRVEELVFLNRVGRTVTSSLNLEQVLATVMQEATDVLKVEAASILLLDDEGKELIFETVVGPQSEKVKGLRFPLGQGLASWVVRQGQRLLVPDAREDPRFYPGIDGATGFVTKSVLAVPLKVKGKVIGVIEAVNKTGGDFSQADVALLSSMSQSATIAIENARLYKDLQNRMEELKRTQAQLIQSAKLAAIGELAASVAHEINNPLTSIMGFTRLLLQRVDDDDVMKEDLQTIDREAARTKAIVRGLLDFARQREPCLEPADVNEIVQTVMTLIRHQAKSARVTIKASYDETLPLVSLDADQIKQVFLNVVTNALQAMPEGGELKVVTAYRPRERDPECIEGTDSTGCVAIEFHDTGTGISVEDLPHIFDPFFTTKEAGQGTGLGLSISKSIVERHGGRIEVESEVGRGSVFTVLLSVTEGRKAAPRWFDKLDTMAGQREG